MNNRSEAARRAWETRRRSEDVKRRVVARAQQAAGRAISRAKKLGIPIDTDWMRSARAQIINQDYRCALTGIGFDVDYRTEGAGGTHLAPSPDRIDPKLGYVPDNVRWVLWAVNRAKGEMPEELFVRICRSVVAGADSQ